MSDASLLSSENLLLRASAGTGKTFTLATRMIQLLAGGPDRHGASPSEILALTFTKAAAYEIYAKLVERLAAAAADDAAAAEESERVGQLLDRRSFANLLRRVIASQHIASIATIDSFILRMVQFFPLELGFLKGIRLMDSYDEAVARRQIIAQLLDTPDTLPDTDIFEHFDEADSGAAQRSYRARMLSFVDTWSAFLRAHPQAPETAQLLFGSWKEAKGSLCLTEETIQGDTALTALLEPFIRWVKNWDGYSSVIPPTGVEKKIFVTFMRDPNAVSFTFRTKKENLLPKAVADAVHEDIFHMLCRFFAAKLSSAEGESALAERFNALYDQRIRDRGDLTFGDLTDTLQQAGSHAPELAHLEYRFDEHFTHWAIDEFQDTGRAQWACLRELVDNALVPGNQRSVTVVGDLKQAIYAWRGGDERIFGELMANPAFTVRNLSTSFRYGANTCAFVNALFGEDAIGEFSERLTEERQAACPLAGPESATADWLSDGCWQLHRPQPKELQHASDCVRVTQSPRKERGSEDEAPIDTAMFRDLLQLWGRHEAAHSSETVAVLVRSNTEGLRLADYLRSKSLNAVWEGESGITDLPTVQGLLALLRLSEHPQDTLLWKTVCLMPVKIQLCPQCTDAAETAAWVSRELCCRGLARTVETWCHRCSVSENFPPDELTLQMFDTLVGKAADFEARCEADQGIGDFMEYLAASTRRDLAADPSVIRILTMHRSKGLGFDHVFLPMKTPKNSLQFGRSAPIVYEGDPAWMLPTLPREILGTTAAGEVLRLAWEARCDEHIRSALHLAYVALTRSKKSLWLYIEAPSESGTAVHFDDLVRFACSGKALQWTNLGQNKTPEGSELLFAAGNEPTFKTAVATQPTPALPTVDWGPDEGDTDVRRSTPADKEKDRDSEDMGAVFSARYGAGAEHGSEVHAQLAAVEWAEPGSVLATGPLAEAFVRTPATTDLWREYAYERMTDQGLWESGRIDRVVFTETPAGRFATIYDFKTDRNRLRLPDEEFHAQLRDRYGAQLRAYAAAVQALTGIPREHIGAKLLLVGAAPAAVPL